MAFWDNLFNTKSSSGDEVIQNANSKGFILDYMTFHSSPNGKNPYFLYGRTPKFDPKKALDLVRQDPVVRAAIITVVDKVVESGWRLKPRDGNQKSNLPALSDKLKEMRFDRLLRKIVYNLVMYNNAFVEIRKDGKGQVTDLNLLETEHMRIVADDHGDIIEYYQEVGSADHRPTWQPEEVTHIKLDDFTTNVWSEFNIEAAYETILIKDYTRQWMHWFYATNQSRPVLNVEQASGQRFKEFMAYLKAAEQHVGKPIPVEGKLTVSQLQDPRVMEWALEVIKWCDDQIRQLLQVPPLAVGITDTSGRSDGAEQRQYLNTRILNIHRLMEDDITYDLFEKMGYSRVEFVFGVLDETVRTRVFETVQIMRNSQFTPEAIEEYLETQGIVFETDKPLLSQEDLMQMSNKELGTGKEGMKGNQSADAAQSRKRQNSEDIQKENRTVKE